MQSSRYSNTAGPKALGPAGGRHGSPPAATFGGGLSRSLGAGLAAILAAGGATSNKTENATGGVRHIRQLLTANTWVLDAGASSLAKPSQTHVTVAFSGAGVVSGMAACNRYTGNYTLHGTTVRITHISQTTQTCSAEKMSAESDYLLALRAVRDVDASTRDRLKLTGGRNLRLTYDAAKSS
jgi:heat shock protein HslJ